MHDQATRRRAAESIAVGVAWRLACAAIGAALGLYIARGLTAAVDFLAPLN